MPNHWRKNVEDIVLTINSFFYASVIVFGAAYFITPKEEGFYGYLWRFSVAWVAISGVLSCYTIMMCGTRLFANWCVAKTQRYEAQLVDGARTLPLGIQKLSGDDEQGTSCTVCCDNKAVCAAFPCRHVGTCIKCTRKLKEAKCVICKKGAEFARRYFP